MILKRFVDSSARTARFLLCLGCFFSFLPALAASPLSPAAAFKPDVRALDAETLEIHFEIAPGYYLYRDKFRFAIRGEAARLGGPSLPPGQEKNDGNFGLVQIYTHEVSIRLPVERAASGALPLTLEVSSQGCAESGICYPPQTQTLSAELPAPGSAPAAGEESGRIAQALKNAGFWANLLFFFAAGLGLSLTPCVFPMIPILSGIIVRSLGKSVRPTRGRGFLLALIYVLGMALTYAGAGVVAGFTGTLISSTLQNPWVLSAFALVFVVLALSMFGFYELQLPSALQSRLSEEAGQQRSGAVGIFLMGALSALILGPCVAAPLAGALLYIGQTGDAFLGGAALFVMALGMGVPLLAVGISAGVLPKSGPWMEGVKKGFGVVLLATAVWLVVPLLPAVLPMLAWALLLIIPAIFLHALDPLPPVARGWQRFWKGVGIVMLLTGASLLIGALGGSRDPLQPLAGMRVSAQPPLGRTAPSFERIASLSALQARLEHAGQPVMLDFYADWCRTCKEMEQGTFADPAIREKLARFILLQADVSASSADDLALLAHFGFFGPPGLAFFDADGQERRELRLVGFQDAAGFARHLDQALAPGPARNPPGAWSSFSGRLPGPAPL